MDITDVDVHNDASVDEMLAVHHAAEGADTPDEPLKPIHPYRIRLRQAEYTLKTLYRVARVDGRIAGLAVVELPLKENRHCSSGEVVVDPAYRRRGIGTALLHDAMRLARDNGRGTLAIETRASGGWDGAIVRPEAGRRFLEKHGFTLALTSINQRAKVDALSSRVERRMYDEALAASPRYEAIEWTGAMPDELMEPVARLNSIFLEEIPLGELELEPEKVDAERQRAAQSRSLERGTFQCGVVARPWGGSEIVANTILEAESGMDDYAHQQITLVDPRHRGHRLGMRLKIANLRLLRTARPTVRYVDTDNAADNAHMIAINEQLGFSRVDYSREYQREL